MNEDQISKPKRRRAALVLFVAVIALALFLGSAFFLIRAFVSSGITRSPDNMFGDQNLKTAVALIELHKVRYGKYPGSLSELRFTGHWDQIAIQSVSYYPSADRATYYVEVERGWIGKPDLVMPEEFWRGTGYSTALKPAGEH